MIVNYERLQQISHLRREYINSIGLRRQDLPTEPLLLFGHWLKQAYKAKLSDPTAMVLATVSKDGQPWQRTVLLKHYNKKRLIFYTNLHSRKAHHIINNPYVSLLFPWNMLERQVLIVGKAKKISKEEAIKYFYSRPYNSQISTWASRQSSFISTRNELENKFLKLKQKFQDNKVPFPKFWGGFCIFIKQVEFWQGGKNRLHDRFLYQRYKNSWKINRLAP